MTTTRFISEPISVEHNEPPALEKKPHAPDRFVWGDDALEIVALISEWQEFERRGRMRANMRPENLARARQRGSWGVGRFFFRVEVADGRIFDLYYDRAPKGSDQRKGSWTLFQEILEP